ncbi:DNA ligase 4 [Dorcoceras hygrometricum]|uniref:DNA ligase 4 n=1 Tax=Dorcoceras hygrometricum TaxID=472368 RepID=A0A2Z7AFP6_9LAMI|nr:DNA ligase 4 [Dorcoceras hygrometricum]
MTFRVVRTNQYNKDLVLIHSTNGNHLESPNEGSSIDHQVTIYLHAQNITMFPTNETWKSHFQNPPPMLNTLSSVSVRESRIQYLCDPQWFRDTASRGPTTIVAPESQFRTCPSDHDNIGYPRMSASGESSTTMHRLLHASGSHPIPPPNDPKTNQYNQDLGLIHSTNGNHLESPNEGSSIDHQTKSDAYANRLEKGDVFAISPSFTQASKSSTKRSVSARGVQRYHSHFNRSYLSPAIEEDKVR